MLCAVCCVCGADGCGLSIRHGIRVRGVRCAARMSILIFSELRVWIYHALLSTGLSRKHRQDLVGLMRGSPVMSRGAWRVFSLRLASDELSEFRDEDVPIACQVLLSSYTALQEKIDVKNVSKLVNHTIALP